MKFVSTVQNVAWFRARYMEGSLTIKPPFQRNPVWGRRQKCSLIESILMGLPVPEIYIQHITTAEGETTYAIVDGQQRIRTVLQFIGVEEDPEEREDNKFALDKLGPGSDWRNVTFDELDEEGKKKFYAFEFAVRYLYTESDEAVRDMFKRLNKYLSPLRPQELRNATYVGPFARLALELANDEYWTENRIITPVSIRRMGDVEFISELLIGLMHGVQGGSAKIIDEYYEQYEDYEDEFPEQRTSTELFDKTLETIKDIIPNIKKTRWSNKTDFYTLFVVIASLLRFGKQKKGKKKELRETLSKFAKEVKLRLADEDARVSEEAISYVRAVEKGANDKPRRSNRHKALLNIIEPYFDTS